MSYLPVGEKAQDVSYEVLFDEEFLGGLVIRYSDIPGLRLATELVLRYLTV